MFTGLVATTGRVERASPAGPDRVERELVVQLGALAADVRVGDSIALSGVCCTATHLEADSARFLLSEETLRRTWLGAAEAGTELNLEGALRAGQPLGGHMVQGHVDGVGEVVDPIDPVTGGELWARVPAELLPYCVIKGSIALDGVSLTVAAIQEDRVMIAVIPHTAQETTLGRAARGQELNIEVDILAKYVERLLETRFGEASGPPAS